jgi:hypothetical protein
MDSAALPPKKRHPPPPPTTTEPAAPPPSSAPTEASKIRGVAPPRRPRVGPQYQADVPDLKQ